jgi:DNA-binding PadR family transcriptional regulator
MTTRQQQVLAILARHAETTLDSILVKAGCDYDALVTLARRGFAVQRHRYDQDAQTRLTYYQITDNGLQHLKRSKVMVEDRDNWKCPYCGSAQVIDETRHYRQFHPFYRSGWSHGYPGVELEAIICSNEQCKELTLEATLCSYESRGGNDSERRGPFTHWGLLPASSAKPQPTYIPEAIRADYAEACAIRDLSPKASATITRRCLQGMIRDFCGISKHRLLDEINELRDRVQAGRAPIGVQADSVDAIDHVRTIGNIGAHMEADINVIVDVDSDEAQVLIDLVEILLDEWYVARHLRQEAFGRLKSVSSDKKVLKQQPPPSGQ